MEQKKPIVSLEIRIHWGDMDAMQHVNNIIYLKWVESTRLLLFEHGATYVSPFIGRLDDISTDGLNLSQKPLKKKKKPITSTLTKN